MTTLSTMIRYANTIIIRSILIWNKFSLLHIFHIGRITNFVRQYTKY